MTNPSADLTFPFLQAPFAYRYLWIFFLGMGVINSILGWRSLLTHIKNNEALKTKYRYLFIQYAIWINLPWLVMGVGILLGGAGGVLDFLVPSSGNLIVVIWWVLFLLMNFILTGWIFFAGGAETLEKYPGLPTFLSGSAAQIKVVVAVGFIFVNFLAVLIYFFNPWARDGQVYSTMVLLDFPVFFSLFFVLFWLLGGWMIAQFGGWVALASSYRTREKYEGELLKWRSAKLNWVYYHTCLNLGANHEGLFISIGYFFHLHHKNLFIPWGDIQTTRSEMVWGHMAVLHFEKTPKIQLEIHEKNITRLKEMAGDPEAFKGFSS